MIDCAIAQPGHQKKSYLYIAFLLLLNVLGFCYYIYYVVENGYLPSPFIFDKSDTFMDLFNTMYWAYDEGRYTEWGSVYPPLGFLFLKIINFLFNGSIYGDAADIRENSQFVIWGFGFIYLIVPALVLKTKLWQDIGTNKKILFYFIIVLSSPMLFALERGNTIILVPVFLALVLSRIGYIRAFSIAILINIKPYFAILLFYYIARKNWKGFISCTLMAGGIFLISGLIFDNHFLVFLANIFDFSQQEDIFSLREVMSMPSSISAFSYVLKNPDGAMFASSLVGPDRIADIIHLIDFIKLIVLLTSFALLMMKSKFIRDIEIFALLIVSISNFGVFVGGYTFIFYMVLIPVIIKMRAKLSYIGLLSVMAIPLDVVPLKTELIGEQYSYIIDNYVFIEWTWGLGSIVRPVANFILLGLLCYEFFLKKQKVIAKMS